MEQGLIVELLIVQIVLIVSLFLVLAFVLRARHNIKLEKKFNKYTVLPLENNETSIFDRINNFIQKVIKGLSNLLSKSVFLKRYASTYDKHIKYDELDVKTGMDFISIKFLIGLVTMILYIVTMMFQYVSISFAWLLLSFLLGFFLIDIYLNIEYKKRRKQISDDLLKAIIIMNNSFKSGMSIMQAIEIVKNELEGAIGDEFKKIYLDMSYGLTIETVFDRFYNRVKLDDAKFITTSLTLLNKTGGNIVKVFKSIEREFFDKKKLNDELKTTNASSQFVYKLLLAIPFIISFLIFILNPSYFNPLFKTEIGVLVLVLIVLLYVMYALIIRRIMRIDL